MEAASVVIFRILCALVIAIEVTANLNDNAEVPKFGKLIDNITVPVSREAILGCVVEDLGTYKVAWLRVDTQTILTIHSHVITKNHRIGVTHSDHRSWNLHIRDVKESDHGWYMCQINTDPMKSQMGFLQVVVPPDILDYTTSSDMVIREGSNVTLQCNASGSPTPSITWRREDSLNIQLGNGQEVSSIDGPIFNITRVNRLHMGAYLCIASNGVPPTPSKRIMLIVQFPPMIWIQNQLVGAREGEPMTLECHSEAFPRSINYWTKENGDIITNGAKYKPVLLDNAYKVHMKLTIRAVRIQDYGSYKCIAKNSLGETDGSIKLYQIPAPSTTSQTTISTNTSYVFENENKIIFKEKEMSQNRHKNLEKNEGSRTLDHLSNSDASSRKKLKKVREDLEKISSSSIINRSSLNTCTLSLLLHLINIYYTIK